MRLVTIARLGLSTLVLALFVCIAQPTYAQVGDDVVPEVEQAEAVFQQAIEAFQEGDYGMAYRRFRVVYEGYRLHRTTTAAILMAGKSLYREGDYQRAADLLDEFIRTFPTSSYLGEADRTLALIREQLGEEAPEARIIRLGIALPMTDNDAALTQALFNGIRLAVDAHNRSEEVSVQMVFRDSQNSQSGAQSAIASLVNANVDMIIGPLYSEEAEGAAQAAERAGVVLIAPLATDESVARGRRYVFQANPTITSRGRMMADVAMNDLGARRVGIVAEQGDDISERMAEGFQQEADRLGASVAFYERISSRDWDELTEQLEAFDLTTLDALYLPVGSSNARRNVDAALTNLDRAGVLPRVLGNTQWDELTSTRLANAFGVIYTKDFHVDDDDTLVQNFRLTYRQLAEQAPGRLAFVGYDVTRFMLAQAVRAPDQPLEDAIHEASRFQGLGMDIEFANGNANEAIFFFRYGNDGAERYR